MNGKNFSFPYDTPYDIQLDFMQKYHIISVSATDIFLVYIQLWILIKYPYLNRLPEPYFTIEVCLTYNFIIG